MSQDSRIDASPEIVAEEDDDVLGQLVQRAEEAWTEVFHARRVAREADQAVRETLVGRTVLVTGTTTGLIAGGALSPRRERFENQPAYVRAVLYSFNEHYPAYSDILRIVTPDGQLWQMSVSGTKAVLVDEEQSDPAS